MVRIDINKEFLDKTSKEALDRAKEENDEIEELSYPNLIFGDEPPTLEFDKNDSQLIINGSLMEGNKSFGWIDLKITIDTELALEIIESYMKKLGKLKTVMEALK